MQLIRCEDDEWLWSTSTAPSGDDGMKQQQKQQFPGVVAVVRDMWRSFVEFVCSFVLDSKRRYARRGHAPQKEVAKTSVDGDVIMMMQKNF